MRIIAKRQRRINPFAIEQAGFVTPLVLGDCEFTFPIGKGADNLTKLLGLIILLQRVMMQHAQELGANAIIGVRYDANEVMDGITEVLAYGTAVVVEKA
jgi:hypothetical protein